MSHRVNLSKLPPESYRAILTSAAERAVSYLEQVNHRRVFPDNAALDNLIRFGGAVPEHAEDVTETIKLLNDVGSAATVATTGGRYFGFVVDDAILPLWRHTGWQTPGIKTRVYMSCRRLLHTLKTSCLDGCSKLLIESAAPLEKIARPPIDNSVKELPRLIVLNFMKTTIAFLILLCSSVSLATAKLAPRWPVHAHTPPAHHPLFVLVDGRWAPWIDGEF